MQKQPLYRTLKNLQSKAVASATIERPARFSAVPFENVLDLLIKTKLEEAQIIQHEKSELLSSWQAMQTAEMPTASSSFMVIEGRNIIYSRIKQMINATQNQLLIIFTVQGLARANQFGLLDIDFKHPLRSSNVQFRLLTHLSRENIGVMQTILEETPKTEMRFEIRNPNLASSLFPRMVIRDKEEAVFFINPNIDESSPEQDDLCLWTNCKSLIHSFLAMFEELWHNSTEIEQKIAEIKSGKPATKTYAISDAEVVGKKYEEVVQSARSEIVLLTSSNGLILASGNTSKFYNLARRGVSVKIMAPLGKENWEAMKQLSTVCAVRHSPANYLETTVIDGKHLFQASARATYQGRADLDLTFHLGSSYYTDDLELVKKTKKALDDIWASTQAPSDVTLESIGGVGYPVFPLPKEDLLEKMGLKIIDLKPPGTLTEKEVLNKIIHKKKMVCTDLSKDPSRVYGSFAIGVIHPPTRYNLPDMLVQVWKIEEQSSFGEENFMTIYLELETKVGKVFVPAAIAGDNPKAEPLRRNTYAGTPAIENMHFYNKGKLQVSVHGNTLFAGWTVPVPLYPPKYILPPGCLVIEGHGKVKPSGHTMVMPSGFRLVNQYNYFDAYVTFIHPASKYSGPSTDGVLARDTIVTVIPP